MEAKAYIGTYAKYNNGSLKGAWLDLFDYGNYNEFLAACKELHADENDPEYMVQDYSLEGMLESLRYRLNESVQSIKCFYDISAVFHISSDQFRYVIDIASYGHTVEEAIKIVKNENYSVYANREDLAECILECYEIRHDNPIALYIDTDKLVNDHEMNATIITTHNDELIEIHH